MPGAAVSRSAADFFAIEDISRKVALHLLTASDKCHFSKCCKNFYRSLATSRMRDIDVSVARLDSLVMFLTTYKDIGACRSLKVRNST